MIERTHSDSSERQAKQEREDRLRWQSQLMLGLVLAASVTGLIAIGAGNWTQATAEGFAICAAFGVLVWRLRAATPPAAVAGFILTSAIYLSTVQQPAGGWSRTALLSGLSLFVLAFAATGFRRSQKEQSGLAESRRGRGASQVAANMGAAALAGLAAYFFAPPQYVSHLYLFNGREFTGFPALPPALFIPLVAALAEAAADTISSEIGQAIGGTPWLLTSFERVPAGTDGAISLAGTSAGIIAAAIVAATAVPTIGLDWEQAAYACFAAIAGLFADTLLGATLERQDWLNNDSVNFLSTAVAAAIALFFLSR